MKALPSLVLIALALLALGGFVTPASARFSQSRADGGNLISTDSLDPPTTLTASASGTSIVLGWTATTDAYASGYMVLRSTSSGGPYSQVGGNVTPRTTTSFTDATVTSGLTYYYVLHSYYQGWTSADSNQASAAVSSSSWLATGSYTGDGVDNRAITGVGFAPDVVIIKCDCAQDAIIRTSAMTGDASKWLGNAGALVSNNIQSLDANGFSVGTDLQVNGKNKTYYWTAMKAGTHLKVGSYVGNGADNRSITGVGFQPVWVLTLGAGADSVFRPGSVAGDVSYLIDGSDQLADHIQALQADGFQVGADADVNQAGTTYYYLAWRAGTGAVVESTYAGDGSDDRSIAGVGFQPSFVWIKRDTASVANWRPASLTGDAAFSWIGTSAANAIQQLEPDGFQIGSKATVNNKKDSYEYLALK